MAEVATDIIKVNENIYKKGLDWLIYDGDPLANVKHKYAIKIFNTAGDVIGGTCVLNESTREYDWWYNLGFSAGYDMANVQPNVVSVLFDAVEYSETTFDDIEDLNGSGLGPVYDNGVDQAVAYGLYFLVEVAGKHVPDDESNVLFKKKINPQIVNIGNKFSFNDIIFKMVPESGVMSTP